MTRVSSEVIFFGNPLKFEIMNFVMVVETGEEHGGFPSTVGQLQSGGPGFFQHLLDGGGPHHKMEK